MRRRAWLGASVVVVALAGWLGWPVSGGAPCAQAGELGCHDIVDRMADLMSFDGADARIKMVLIDRRGSEVERVVQLRSKVKDGQNRSLIRFLQPADVAGTGFLMLEHQGREDDQFLFMPALGKVQRITGGASGNKKDRFMGTDMTYEDMESIEREQWDCLRLPDETVAGQAVWVIESTPKAGTESQYSKRKAWISQQTNVPLKVEFYDKRDRLQKTMLVSRLKKVDGNWIAMDTMIEDLRRKHKTRLIVETITFDVEIPDQVFTTRTLERG